MVQSIYDKMYSKKNGNQAIDLIRISHLTALNIIWSGRGMSNLKARLLMTLTVK